MNTMDLKIAKLGETQLSRLQLLERELNCLIVAYKLSCEPIQLSQSKLKQLQALEKDLDVTLIAYDESRLNMKGVSFLDKILDRKQMDKLRKLEAELGNRVVNPQSKVPLAEVSDLELETIQVVEKELNVILIIYQQLCSKPKIAKLSNKQVSKLVSFEKEVGGRLVALRPSLRLATLSANQIKQVQKLEKELKDTLLAFEPGACC